MNSHRAILRDARTLVVKVGTAVLTGGTGSIDRAYLVDLAAIVARERQSGRRVLIVSSGAVGAGVGALSLPGRPGDVATLQAAAAAGQPLLMSLWREAFAVRGVPAAQILLGRDDLDSRERFLNIRNCVHALFSLNAVPIANENDTVATEEISLGDNDVLAARLAVSVQADALVILTTGPGVLDGHDRVVDEARDADALARLIRPTKTTQGRGGMATKVEAARLAALAGVATVIAPGRPAESLARVCAGEAVGTCVAPGESKHAGRRRWIALGATPAGALIIDDGAARAVVERGASLLAKGVVGVEGRFAAGDVVAVRAASGRELARGLANVSADEARLIAGRDSRDFEAVLGRQTHVEVIHRDNMVLA